jgi:hypothetical protein
LGTSFQILLGHDAGGEKMGKARMRPHHFSSGKRQFAVGVIDTLGAVGLRNRTGDIAHDGVEGVGR